MVTTSGPGVIALGVTRILQGLDEDLSDENLLQTPERVAKFYQEFHHDKHISAPEILTPTFECDYDQMVMQKGISFVALCAHHLLPFRGNAAVAYIPKGRVVGLSKLARLVHHFAKRLTIQEKITQQIADALDEVLTPKGVMVVLSAAHDCMSIRGVSEPEAITVTSAVKGVFLDNKKDSKNEFMQLLRT